MAGQAITVRVDLRLAAALEQEVATTGATGPEIIRRLLTTHLRDTRTFRLMRLRKQACNGVSR